MLDSASFGGPGWMARKGSYREDLEAGVYGGRCGVTQESAPLKRVVLAWPQDSLDTMDLDAALLLRKVDLKKLRSQTENIALFYEDKGVRVVVYKPRELAPPNLIFMRDTFLMTPEGAFLGRLGGHARAGEERFVSEALATNGVPMIGATRGHGCLEGADALWLNEKKVLISTGFRTNSEAVSQASALLAQMDVSTKVVRLPQGTQHLLGAVNFVAPDRAVVRADLCTPEIQKALDEDGISILRLEPSEEVVSGFAMNFVALKPNCIVMPGHCPFTRQFYERNGIETFDLDVSEYVNAGGGLGCLTGIIRRE